MFETNFVFSITGSGYLKDIKIKKINGKIQNLKPPVNLNDFGDFSNTINNIKKMERKEIIKFRFKAETKNKKNINGLSHFIFKPFY